MQSTVAIWIGAYGHAGGLKYLSQIDCNHFKTAVQLSMRRQLRKSVRKTIPASRQICSLVSRLVHSFCNTQRVNLHIKTVSVRTGRHCQRCYTSDCVSVCLQNSCAGEMQFVSVFEMRGKNQSDDKMQPFLGW